LLGRTGLHQDSADNDSRYKQGNSAQIDSYSTHGRPPGPADFAQTIRLTAQCTQLLLTHERTSSRAREACLGAPAKAGKQQIPRSPEATSEMTTKTPGRAQSRRALSCKAVGALGCDFFTRVALHARASPTVGWQ